jgi:hypothetical protein
MSIYGISALTTVAADVLVAAPQAFSHIHGAAILSGLPLHSILPSTITARMLVCNTATNIVVPYWETHRMEEPQLAKIQACIHIRAVCADALQVSSHLPGVRAPTLECPALQAAYPA